MAGIGVAEIAENRQRAEPCPLRLARSARGLMSVTEVGQGLAQLELAAELPQEADGPLIAADGQLRFAQAVPDVPDAVPGLRIGNLQP